MAILNKEAGCVVLRIVYAGAPMSGKTESMRSLSELLFGARRGEEELFSPETTDGRTLYFDWLNYTGGYFRGYKVNCQLISVPGQKTLKNRRKTLVEMADVVVFVVDSENGKLETAINYYEEMQPWLERQDEPPVGVILQANKRDVPDVIPMPTIYEAFDDNPNFLVIETIATRSSGIRESFVTAVRVGLERASWLLENERMTFGIPDLDSGEALLSLISKQEHFESKELLQSISAGNEGATPVALRQPVALNFDTDQLQHVIQLEREAKERESQTRAEASQDTPPAVEHDYQSTEECLQAEADFTPGNLEGNTEVAPDENNIEAFSQTEDVSPENITMIRPSLPHKDVIAGSVFPPISGRIILHKLAEEDVSFDQTTEEGNWYATIGNEWRLISRQPDSYTSSNDARLNLGRYANTHKKLGPLLSEHRCLAIVESERHDEWRIWQIIRNEITLGELLRNALMEQRPPQRIAEQIFIIAEKFMDSCRQLRESGIEAELSVNNIALYKNKPVFTGYLSLTPDEPSSLPLLELMKLNFEPMISQSLHENPHLSLSIPYILRPLVVFARGRQDFLEMIEVLKALLIGRH